LLKKKKRVLRNRATEFTVRTILVPVDFSKPAVHAMDYAVRFAQVFGSRLFLLHVVEQSAIAVDSTQWVDIYSQAKLVAKSRLERFARRIKKMDIPVTAEIIRGAAYAEIIRFARRHRADLIVIGTHGRTGLQRWIMGSVAERVIRLAPCPVLSIQPPSTRSHRSR
jgi:universal stress protein A